MVSAKSPGWNWLPCQESGGSSRQPRSPMMFVAFIYNFKISITLYLNNIYIYTYIIYIYIYLFMYLDLGYTWCYPLNSSGKSGSLIWGQVLWSYKGPLVTGYRKHCAFWPDIYIYGFGREKLLFFRHSKLFCLIGGRSEWWWNTCGVGQWLALTASLLRSCPLIVCQ